MIVLVPYFGAFIATRLISSWIYGEEVWKRYKHASLKVVLCVGCFQNILYCFSIVLNPPESSSFDGIILQLRWPSWWSYYHSKSTACIVAIHRTACSNLLCLVFLHKIDLLFQIVTATLHWTLILVTLGSSHLVINYAKKSATFDPFPLQTSFENQLV